MKGYIRNDYTQLLVYIIHCGISLEIINEKKKH